jgi:peptidoglycan/xylan/chitin deacetylase (PgdA/CDA1 family)
MAGKFKMLARPIYSAGSVLCLHSVTTPEAPSTDLLHVPLPVLKELVRGIRRYVEIVPLSELVRRHVAGRSTAGLTALTFDDAYLALHSAVEQIFVPQSIPITVFAVSNALETGSAYWWDRISEVYDKATAEQWRRFEGACEIPDAYALGRFGGDRFAQARRFILSEHAGRLEPRAAAGLTALESAVGCRTAQRSMTMTELESLARFECVEIGVHTQSHVVLPSIPDDEAVREIRECYRTLRARIPGSVPILAIPFGLFDANTARIAQRAGMDASLTLTGHSLFHPGKHGIPRHAVDRRTKLSRLLIRMAGVTEGLRRLAGRTPDDFPELPSPPSANQKE